MKYLFVIYLTLNNRTISIFERNKMSKKPYCKVCHDANKPESEYTSHWLKDLNGKTLCPTLLNTECRYCFKLGHTAKFCNVLAKNKRVDKKPQAIIREPTKQKEVITNGYSALYEESDSEDEVKISNVVFPEAKTNWAAIAAKPKEEKAVEVVENSGMIVLNRSNTVKKKEIIKEIVKPIYKKSWADWSDSEEEEDEDDEDDEVYNDAW